MFLNIINGFKLKNDLPTSWGIIIIKKYVYLLSLMILSKYYKPVRK